LAESRKACPSKVSPKLNSLFIKFECTDEKIGHKLVFNLSDLVLEEGMDFTKEDLGALFYRNQKFVD